nr:two pore calcium channel protein 1B [Ipomoea batatas]
MEAALLGEEGGGGGGGPTARWLYRRGGFNRRSDAIVYGSAYQKAAALVDLAEDGVGIPEEILEQPNFSSSAKLYFIFTNFDLLWSLNYFALIVLNFLEVVTLVILMTHVLYPISYEGFQIYWKNVFNKLKVILLLVLIADLVAYVLTLAGVYYLPFRVAPYLRVAFFILNIRELRDSIYILAGMSLTYLNVMVLSLLFLLFSSWLGYVIFEDTLQGKTVFTSYGKTLYQMFILFTTSNNPDVWIAAYKESRWYCLFFVLYVLLGVYFVTNLILAVVYDSFKCELVKQVAHKDRKRLRILEKAFSLIDQDIDLDEFSDLTKAIALKFQKEDSLPCFESYSNIYHSPASEKLRDFVRSSKFEYTIVFILVINFVAVVIESTLDIADSSAQTFWQKIEFVFGWLYVVEMALKIYTYGFENYWRIGQNRFDFVITWVIVIGETATFAAPNGLTFLSNGEWIRYLLIARMLRLIRLLLQVRSYRAFVATFLTLVPSLMPYLGTVFCILCIYCSLGLQVYPESLSSLQIFGGLVNSGNSKLKETDLADSDINVVRIAANLQFVFQSYIDLTGTWWTCIYFISFYVISVLWLLNLIIAFVLEAFQVEMELETAAMSEDGEEREETGKRRPRTVGAKTRSQRVDALLHHMLSSELTESSTS